MEEQDGLLLFLLFPQLNFDLASKEKSKCYKQYKQMALFYSSNQSDFNTLTEFRSDKTKHVVFVEVNQDNPAGSSAKDHEASRR